ncbi:MAG: DNA-processing protein DprA [Brevinema sp.]
MFYKRGKLDIESSPNKVAIVGSRHVNNELKKITFEIAQELAKNECTIVSGYSNGIDEQGHLGCITGGGKTIAVLAEGFAHFRWKSSFQSLNMTKKQLEKHILFISEFKDQEVWKPFRAMQRNQTIINLSDIIIIMSMGEKGGTFNTFQRAYKSKKKIVILDTPEHRKIIDNEPSNLFSDNIIHFVENPSQIIPLVIQNFKTSNLQKNSTMSLSQESSIFYSAN